MKNWGETFAISFDITLDKKWEKDYCPHFLYVEYDDEEKMDYEGKAGIWLCPDDKLFFEANKKDNSHSLDAEYVLTLTPNLEHHIQYKQFRQDDYNGELKRFVKIDDEIVLDRDVNNFTLVYGTVLVEDIIPYGSISNFKMSK